jgi:hypothetical protein
VSLVAAYGIGALIAGKVLAKVGLFKLILGALIAEEIRDHSPGGRGRVSEEAVLGKEKRRNRTQRG